MRGTTRFEFGAFSCRAPPFLAAVQPSFLRLFKVSWGFEGRSFKVGGIRGRAVECFS